MSAAAYERHKANKAAYERKQHQRYLEARKRNARECIPWMLGFGLLALLCLLLGYLWTVFNLNLEVRAGILVMGALAFMSFCVSAMAVCECEF